jgi:hypothetical protein
MAYLEQFFFIGLQHENMENKWSLFIVLTQTFDLDALHPNNITNIQSKMSSTSPVVNNGVKAMCTRVMPYLNLLVEVEHVGFGALFCKNMQK